MNTRANISSVYRHINNQEKYLDDLLNNCPPISLNIYKFPIDDYQKYKTLQKYHGKHYQNVLNNKTFHKPTINIINEQLKIHNYPNTMIKKRYELHQEVNNLVNRIINDNDDHNGYWKINNKINDEEDQTYYNIPDPLLAMTYYSTKHLI
jgi:hypothetical protein